MKDCKPTYKGIRYDNVNQIIEIIKTENFGNPFEGESFSKRQANAVDYQLKAVNILSTDKAKQVFEKGKKNGWDLNKILTELQIPKEQKQIILTTDFGEFYTDELSLRENLIMTLATDNSFVVEVNTVKEENYGKPNEVNKDFIAVMGEGKIGQYYTMEDKDGLYRLHDSKKEAEKYLRNYKADNTQYYSNLTVPGGADYTENEIATPDIVPNIKGHAQFSTVNGIGWFRSDEQKRDKQSVYSEAFYDAQSILEKDIPTTFSFNHDTINVIIKKEKDKWYENAVEYRGESYSETIVKKKEVDLTTLKDLYYNEVLKPDNVYNKEKIPTKTRRVLELQSDLFQKGRNKKDLASSKNIKNLGTPEYDMFGIEEVTFNYEGSTYQSVGELKYYPDENQSEPEEVYYRNGQKITSAEYRKAYKESEAKKSIKDNQFLQLLNKKNNWVTFFVKSIIQDSAKKGYEKILFPKGDTAAKIEGHQTLEEFKKQKENRIKELESSIKDKNHIKLDSGTEYKKIGTNWEVYINGEWKSTSQSIVDTTVKDVSKEITTLKQELTDVESGQTQLSSIANFYETTVANILKKSGFNPIEVTDEYGNKWNEVEINKMAEETISFSKREAGEKIDTLNEGQKQAYQKAIDIVEKPKSDDILDDMFLISGKGGTGKTYTSSVLVEYINKNKYSDVQVVAPTWNAVNELLLADNNSNAVTLASYLGTKMSSPNKDGSQDFILKSMNEIERSAAMGFAPAFITSQYVLIDEASMIGGNGKAPVVYRDAKNPKDVIYKSTDAWETLKFRLKQREELGYGRPKKIIWMGDYAQIPPVGTTQDKEAFIIEHLMSNETQHHILSENMRTNKNDMHKLHEKYRSNIDEARDKRPKSSDETIPKNPLKKEERIDTDNIKYTNNNFEFTDIYKEYFMSDPTNIRNAVIVNYNRASHKNTAAIINQVRSKLFNNTKSPIVDGEYMYVKNNLNIKHNGEQHTLHNEHRVIIKDPTYKENHPVTFTWMKGRRSYSASINLNGYEANVLTDVMGKPVQSQVFIPLQGELERVAGPYNPSIKGYNIGGKAVPYGGYLRLKEQLADLAYAYVVNSHKVQGSSYNYVLVDEGNILGAPVTHKEFNNLIYTAVSRAKKKLVIHNLTNPDQENSKFNRFDEVATSSVENEETGSNKTLNVYWGGKNSSLPQDSPERILSNLAPRSFIWEGREYGSVEHAYQSNKSGTFDETTYNKYLKIQKQSKTSEQLEKETNQLVEKAKKALKGKEKTHIVAFHGGRNFEKPDPKMQYSGEFRNPEIRRIAESSGARYEGQMLFYTQEEEFDLNLAANSSARYALNYGMDNPTLHAYLIPKDVADFGDRGIGEVGVKYNETDKLERVGKVTFERKFAYGKKIKGKGTVAELKAADSLGLMKQLVIESFKQNPNSKAVETLKQYDNFTHNTNELIDQAFLKGLKMAQKEIITNNKTQETKPSQLPAEQQYEDWLYGKIESSNEAMENKRDWIIEQVMNAESQLNKMIAQGKPLTGNGEHIEVLRQFVIDNSPLYTDNAKLDDVYTQRISETDIDNFEIDC